jgi:hypothetical protein
MYKHLYLHDDVATYQFPSGCAAPCQLTQIFHGAPAMIVSYGYWQQFLGDRADLSRVRLTMDRTVYPVIGVMPRGFNFRPGVAGWVSREFVYGMSLNRTAHGRSCLGRPRDRVTVERPAPISIRSLGESETSMEKKLTLQMPPLRLSLTPWLETCVQLS